LFHRVKPSTFSRSLLIIAVACVSACRSDPGSELRVSLQEARESQTASVIVTGLSAAELDALQRARLTEADWESLFAITVGETADDRSPVVKGRYSVMGSMGSMGSPAASGPRGSVVFVPRFPFDAGRTYRARLDPSKLPRPRQSAVVTATLAVPAVATTPTTVVTGVHPAAEVVPENLLRMYLEFSAPMGSRAATDFVRLLEVRGSHEEVVEGAFLPIEADFWNPDHTRYTLFLDPGRVKEGILPNRQRGRPLKAGRRYVLEIASAWPDANRLPLAAAFRHEFRAGRLVHAAMKLADWRVTAPTAGTRDPLVVVFPRPIDHAVVMRALAVEKHAVAVAGAVRLDERDTRWAFTSHEPWTAGDHVLSVQAFLEDPQGNQINVPFEEAVDAPKPERALDTYSIPFSVH
jgi:hypothetical protein